MVKKSLLHKMLPFYLIIPLICLTLAEIGSRTVTVIQTSTGQPKRSLIILDAGHGGIDGGALSCTGVPESQINLQITNRLNDMLHLLGYRTVMLRTSDTSLHTEGNTIASQKVSDLKHRVETVNNQSPALMISIHQNTFSDKRYSGAQVFYAADDESTVTAQQLQANFIRILNPNSKRKAKKATGIYLMEHIHCPGILIECGFLTNEQEEALLRNENYQKKVSAVVAATVSCQIIKTHQAV